MSSVFVFTARSSRVSISKKVLSERIQVGVISLTVTLVIMIAGVLMTYLMTSNISATKGYDIKNLNAQQGLLNRTAENLDLLASQQNSLDAVTNNQLVRNLVSVPMNELVFAPQGGTVVAKK